MKIHNTPHPDAGHTVKIDDGGGVFECLVEDWWDRVSGQSWMHAQGNPACIQYAIRSAVRALPIDNEVIYGKVGPFGHIFHVAEIVKDAA